MQIHSDYDIHGPQNGSWITLSHPVGSNMSVWESQIHDFSKSHRLLIYNLRGHGTDSHSQTKCTIDDLADDVLQLWQALGIQKSHFVGLSLGGCIGVAVATRSPERLQSLTVANSRLEMDEGTSNMWNQRASLVEEKGMQAVVEITLERWLTPQFMASSPDEVNKVRQTLIQTSAHGFAATCRVLAGMHLQSLLPSLQVPTFFVSGLSDKAIATAMIEDYARLNSQFSFAAIDGPHILNLENPGDFNQTVLGFINRHD